LPVAAAAAEALNLAPTTVTVRALLRTHAFAVRAGDAVAADDVAVSVTGVAIAVAVAVAISRLAITVAVAISGIAIAGIAIAGVAVSISGVGVAIPRIAVSISRVAVSIAGVAISVTNRIFGRPCERLERPVTVGLQRARQREPEG
jgi:hypothetical protein